MLRSHTPVVELATVHAAKAGERATLLTASGYVTPRRRATIAAKITARVSVLNVEEGMRVREGQVLALLDDSDARVRFASAKADRDATSAALAAQLQRITTLLADMIAREHQKPNPSDLSGVLTSGAFNHLGTRVLGSWPLERGFIDGLLEGGL